MPTKLDNVAAKTASEICARFQLEHEGARVLLRDDVPPGEFLDLLIHNDHLTDAVRLLAYALPAPAGVLWACRCVRDRPAPERKPEQDAALEAAENWAKAPGDDRARAALQAAQAAPLSTAAGCAAMAAFFGGNNIAPEGAPPVPPPPDVAPRIIAGSIVIAAVGTQPENAAAHYRRFLELGIEAANGSAPKA